MKTAFIGFFLGLVVGIFLEHMWQVTQSPWLNDPLNCIEKPSCPPLDELEEEEPQLKQGFLRVCL